MRAIITILDRPTETSMPFNEFVLYRANHYLNERQILIICGQKDEMPKVIIPKNLEIKYAGRNFKGIRKTVISTIDELEKNKIPYVIHMHQVQSGFLAEIAMLGTGFRKKSLFTVHSTFSGYKFHNKFLSFFNTFLAQQITCVSNTSYQDYPKIIKRLKGNRMQALQNGVDIERIDTILSTTQPMAHNFTNFIYVARLVPIKNHKFLLDVISRCDKSIQFTFVGAEDAERLVRKRAQELGIAERIKFTGLIPRNEVFKELQSSDYYLSPSMLEGLPVSVLEAMYCGLPCILSDIPQHRELAGKETIIIPFEVDKWADEINRLSRLSPDDRTKMSATIQQYVIEKFSLKEMHRKYDAIYELL